MSRARRNQLSIFGLCDVVGRLRREATPDACKWCGDPEWEYYVSVLGRWRRQCAPCEALTRAPLPYLLYYGEYLRLRGEKAATEEG